MCERDGWVLGGQSLSRENNFQLVPYREKSGPRVKEWFANHDGRVG